MTWLWYALCGILGGVLAGMGMGGGTLTIPLLVLLLDVEQGTAQFVNLLAFLPAGGAALIMHLKNKLVKSHNLAFILIPAVLAAALTSYFALASSDGMLKHLFGGFLTLLSVGLFLTGTFKENL